MRCQLLVPVLTVHAGLACTPGCGCVYALNKLMARVLDSHSGNKSVGSKDWWGISLSWRDCFLVAGGEVDPAWALLCRNGHYLTSS